MRASLQLRPVARWIALWAAVLSMVGGWTSQTAYAARLAAEDPCTRACPCDSESGSHDAEHDESDRSGESAHDEPCSDDEHASGPSAPCEDDCADTCADCCGHLSGTVAVIATSTESIVVAVGRLDPAPVRSTAGPGCGVDVFRPPRA